MNIERQEMTQAAQAIMPAPDPTEVSPVTRAFCTWAKDAPAGDWCQYHVGQLGIDRSRSKPLNELAETVMLLQDYGYVRASQMRLPHDVDGNAAYLATRTGTGYPPALIIECQIGAIDFRALLAIKRRAADQSAARALRYALALPERGAIAMLNSLSARGMVTRAASGGGWELSEGIRAKVF